ncbi:endonuclease [candidate division WWE3 bacterium CG06_land_8_20_14_3_00_42_16]|uniref:Endonuclease n=1 Tax=candidate division WWE3 bacterium CG06_land_8_20_14_3_00_42_16 TaxID=1975083 RepID=A0A2M7ALP2_UNCKA|nr:MAG: endonuclease [candidate division WWE3 bacterium CG06_land_8_20_14_3_00_42_16]
MYHLYILICSDGTLYAGITTNPERRVEEHNSSDLGAKYTLHRRPVQLVYAKRFRTRSKALKAEAQIKKMTRKEKLEMIERPR